MLNESLKSEDDIVSSWESNDVLISVCCITYNHEKYISQTIESFLKQDTKQAFEVIIHDDASTDKTASIIKTYQERYPRIFKCIFQKENQFSKGVRMLPTFCFPLVRGKFIAVCEGDDYWTDEKKLSKQLSVLNKYPSINLCFHLSAVMKEGEVTPVVTGSDDDQTIYSMSDIIMGDFHLVQTNTMFFRKESLKYLDLKILSKSPIGDVWIKLSAALEGGAVCLNQNMSVYRVAGSGSWGETMQSGDAFLSFVDKMLNSVDDFDAHWAYKFTQEFRSYKIKFISAVLSNKNLSIQKKFSFFARNKQLFPINDRLFIYSKIIVRVIVFKVLKFWQTMKRVVS